MHKLKFTGNCDEVVFNSSCAKQKFWYHSYYFDNGFKISGDYNIGNDIKDYGFPDSMKGMKVLDIGTASGWFSFYFEQLGADVTSVDARGSCDFDVKGTYKYPPLVSKKPKPDRIDPNGNQIYDYDSTANSSFWIMRELLKSKVKFVNSRVYDISPKLFNEKKFDLVFMGSILLHLRDPIGALMAARSVCNDRLIATTPFMQQFNKDSDPHMMSLIKSDKVSWWLPNIPCYRQWFLNAGFASVDTEYKVTLTADKNKQNQFPSVTPNVTQLLQIGDARIHND